LTKPVKPAVFPLLLITFAALFAPCAAEPAPDYVGRAQCVACHAEQDARWTGSNHDLAMQEATGASVLGDFNDAIFDWFGVRSRFYRQDGRFMVRTDGPDGRLQDYRVKYTFGVAPLQQYLIEFPGWRLQALDIAWDSRPREAGGQRWFHLHPEDQVPAGDVLHWTGPNLNWNYMCADCHSTNLRKGYDAGSGSYHTTWSEIDVSCEACHGPGSAHVRWAEQKARGEPAEVRDMGLTVRLNERTGVAWTIDPVTGRPSRSEPRRSDREIQVCARCHSRRSQLTDQAAAGQPFLDAFRPALLTEGLYYPDGQIQDEVYEWGSFLQSKMHHAGVTCSDCHDPHAATLRLPGDLVCAQCHAPERFAAKAHHFHVEGGRGAGCIECHMPTTNYMVVDARHDHSMRVPRPDLSVALGTPNACNRCHADRTPQWATQQIDAWYGHPARGWQRYAPAMAAARAGLPGVAGLLGEVIADPDQPAIARATALQALAAYPSRETFGLIQAGLGADEALERLGASAGIDGLGARGTALAIGALWDDLRAIRIEAARQLAGFPQVQWPEAARDRLAAGIGEYVAAQTFNAERPEAQVNLGGLYAELKRSGEAEAAYREAIRLQPDFIPAYTNLAQLLSDAGRETEADGLLRNGLGRNPSAALAHALGLSLVRQKRSDEALLRLGEAAAQDPGNARYAYVHAVALQAAGRLAEALQVLSLASERHPGDAEILVALATFHRDAGRRDRALDYARRLQALLPGNPAVDGLVRELGP
jgi:tetratricopeptide (TPR) repeat protein